MTDGKKDSKGTTSGRPFGHYDPEKVINQIAKERDEAQARFSVLWAFLKWVQSRDWTLNQLDERARELDYQGSAEIGIDFVAERDKLRAERDEWKRRAIAHGCDAEKGDVDCG